MSADKQYFYEKARDTFFAVMLVLLLPGFCYAADGQYRIKVTDSDDDSYSYVNFKADTDWWYEKYVTVNSDSTVYSNYLSVPAGSRTITIKWTDPDTNETYYETQNIYVSAGGQTQADFTIRRNPLYHIKVVNNDDDGYPYVYFKTDAESSYTKYVSVGSNGASVNSYGLPITKGSHSVTIKWTDPDKGTEDSQTSGSQTISLSEDKEYTFTIPKFPINGQYRIKVTDNDDDGYPYVYFKADTETDYNKYVSVSSGSSVYSNYQTVTSGSRTITIKWTDPDTNETYYETQTINVTTGGQTQADFTIRRNPLYHIRVVNNDDDGYPYVYFKTDAESSYTKYVSVGSDGASVSSYSIPIIKGSHSGTIKWTDPDKGTEDSQTSGSQTINLGDDKEFGFTIPRYVPTLPEITSLSCSTGSSSVTCSWTGKNATSYEIMLDANGQSTGNTSITYSYSSLQAGHTYTFQVRAYGGGQYSAWKTTTFTTPAAVPEVTSLSCSTGSSSVTCSWTGKNASSYEIMLDADGQSTGNTSVTYSYSSLQAGHTYTFQVRAYGGGQYSAWKTTTFTTPAMPPEPAFVCSPLEGTSVLVVSCDASASKYTTQYSWRLTGDIVGTGVVATFNLDKTGDYDVTLTATGQGGSKSLTKAGYIHVKQSCESPIQALSAISEESDDQIVPGDEGSVDITAGNSCAIDVYNVSISFSSNNPALILTGGTQASYTKILKGAQIELPPIMYYVKLFKNQSDSYNNPEIASEIDNIIRNNGDISLKDSIRADITYMIYQDGRYIERSYQALLSVLKRNGDNYKITFPDFSSITGMPPVSGDEQLEFYLKGGGDKDFHHPGYYGVKVEALLAGTYPNKIFPDDPFLIAKNVYEYVSKRLEPYRYPNYFYPDSQLYDWRAEGYIGMGDQSINPSITVYYPNDPPHSVQGHICIEHAYFFTSLIRNLGIPSREVNVGLRVAANAWAQEAAAQAYFNNTWNFFDPSERVTEPNGYIGIGFMGYRMYYAFNSVGNYSFPTTPKGSYKGHNWNVMTLTGDIKEGSTWKELTPGSREGTIFVAASPFTMILSDDSGRRIGNPSGTTAGVGRAEGGAAKEQNYLLEVPGAAYTPAGMVVYGDSSNPDSKAITDETILYPSSEIKDNKMNFKLNITGTENGDGAIYISRMKSDGETELLAEKKVSVKTGESAEYRISADYTTDPPTVQINNECKYDLNGNGIPADAADVNMMIQANVGDIEATEMFDLNGNGIPADAADVNMMIQANVGDISPCK